MAKEYVKLWLSYSEVPAVAVDYAVDGETGEIMEPSEQ